MADRRRESQTGSRRRGPGRPRIPIHLDWLGLRQDAETHPCPDCGAAPGEHCHRPNGNRMYDPPAHLPRIEATIRTTEGESK